MPAPDGQGGVQHPHAYVQNRIDRLARQRVQHLTAKGPVLWRMGHGPVVQRMPLGVQNTAQQIRPDRGGIAVADQPYPRAGGDLCAGRVQKQHVAPVLKADDFTRRRRAAQRVDLANRAGRGGKARAFHDQSIIADHAALKFQRLMRRNRL